MAYSSSRYQITTNGVLTLTLLALITTIQVSMLEDLPQSSGPNYQVVYPDDSGNDSTHIYFGLIVSFGKEINSSGIVSGVRLALDWINRDPYLLKNYTLHYVLADSQCQRTVALSAFFEQMTNSPTKLALIGAGCSPATEPTAEVSNFFNISQLSCSSGSIELSDRNRFPKHFQVLHNSSTVAATYHGIVNEYKWRHVAFIVQDEKLFSAPVEIARKRFDQENITYSIYKFSTSEGVSSLDPRPFENPEERIYIFASYERHAAHLLCEAFGKKVDYSSHVYVVNAWYSREWWLKAQERYNTTCTGQDLKLMLNRALAVNFLDTDLANDTSMGINSTIYLEEIKKHMAIYSEHIDSIHYCFDAAWTLAYALNRTLYDIESNTTLNRDLSENYGVSGRDFRLEDFHYSNNGLLNVVFGHMSDPTMSFDGISGRVVFTENGTRIAYRLLVHQFRSIEHNDSTSLVLVRIGTFILNVTSNNFFLSYSNKESVETVWPDGIPYDGQVERMLTTLFLPVTIVYSILASFGIAFAVGCLLFNFILRKNKLIRLSSHNLNYLIIFGSLLFFLDVYIFVLPTTDPTVVMNKCTVVLWLTGLGYSFCFGTIMTKMFRIWYIFHNPKPGKKRAIRDWMLAVAVFSLVGIDIVILTAYVAVIGTSGETGVSRIQNKEFMPQQTADDVTTQHLIYVCDSTIRDAVVGIFYVYKAILQVAAILLAFLTRKVKVKGLDDSKYIAAIIYITSIILAVFIVAEYTLKDFANAYAAVFSTGVIIASTCVLGLVFIPKMIVMYKDPKGETVFSRPGNSTAITESKIGTQNENTTSKEVDVLQHRIQELKELLSVNGVDVPPEKIEDQGTATLKVQ